MTIQVLDKGFLRLTNFMGGDAVVVQSARVSFGQGSKGEEQDRKLIRYLLAHGHETPFEQSVFQFHAKCPIFVARQWFRHRWSSFNEISGRYTVFAEDEYYVPDKKRVKEETNKQGSIAADIPDEGHRAFAEKIRAESERAVAAYRALLAEGTAKELARIVLPLNMYTQFYWSVNARSLMNFLRLRCDVHAQREIRLYADAARTVFRERMPWTAEVFDEVSPASRP
ncbi:MAG: FAD-dependent thymidylate synthase [Candidatus Latescibacterota bacterium]|nr:MAG: FAD-dependent thymidylate synthase [Candidatus Latescibacterota bacterium]